MKTYTVHWWEEHIVGKQVTLEAVDEWDAQERAMDGDIGDNQIESELHEVTDSGIIKATIIKD